MPTTSTSGTEFQLRKSPDGGGSAPSSTKDVNKSLNAHSLLLAPGILAGILAYLVYPPLDQGVLVTLGVCVLFLPMALQLRSTVRKRLSEDAGRLRTAYLYSSLALAILALLPLLNGWLDRSPRRIVTTTIVKKTFTRGRSGARYLLTVSSWRPGRSEENFTVDSRTFSRTAVGEAVTVEVHKGYFGVPWSGNVSPK